MNQERFDIEYEGNRILENTRIDGNLKTDKSVYLDDIGSYLLVTCDCDNMEQFKELTEQAAEVVLDPALILV